MRTAGIIIIVLACSGMGLSFLSQATAFMRYGARAPMGIIQWCHASRKQDSKTIEHLDSVPAFALNQESWSGRINYSLYKRIFERKNEMKRCVLGLVLVALLVPAAAVAQESEEPQDAEFQMEMRERELELQQLEHEAALKQQMGELEVEKHKLELERLRKAHKDGPHALLLVVIVIHILTAIWVYQDIRQRGSGSGIWIVIALLAGLVGTLVYAVVRLGNSEKKPAK